MWRRTLSLMAFLGLAVTTTGCSITGALGLGCGECGEGCGEPCGDCAPMADFACAAPAVEICEPVCAEPTCAAPIIEPIIPACPDCAAPVPGCTTCAPAAMPMMPAPTAPAPMAPAPTGMTPNAEPPQTAAAPTQPFSAEPYPPAPAMRTAPTDVPPTVPNPEAFESTNDDLNTTSYRPRVLQHQRVIPVRGYEGVGQVRQAGAAIPRRTVRQPTSDDQLPVMRLD